MDTAGAWETCTKKLSALSRQPSARTGAPLLAGVAGSGAFACVGMDAFVRPVEQGEACHRDPLAIALPPRKNTSFLVPQMTREGRKLQGASCHRTHCNLFRRIRTRIVVLGRGLRFSPFELSLPKFRGFRGIGPGGYGGFFEEVPPAFMVVTGTLRFLESLHSGFSLLLPADNRDHSGRPVGSDVVQDEGVRGVVIVACQKKSICDGVNRLSPPDCVQKRRGDLPRISPLRRIRRLRQPERFRLASPWGPW